MAASGSSKCEKHKRKAWHREKNESRHERGYGWKWDKIRAIVLRRDQFLCVPCKKLGFVRKATAVDHIKNKASGGTDDLENLQSICEQCHKEKTQKESKNGRYNSAN
jgi:5-methylcytosine-specific restriction protein A